MKIFVLIYLLVILKSVICGISGTKTDLREKGIDFTPLCPDIAIISRSIGGLPSIYPQCKCDKNKK
jgi:hypothetical protein